ncbi:MAG: tRNA 2-thiocytidine biosynthesis TtcA family protein [candidate division WOR-3 bacterium]
MHRSERLLRAALNPNRLIEDGERVCIGVSGGADSLCLLITLLDYNRRHRKGWQLYPVHINPGFPNWKTKGIERLCERMGLTCLVKTIDVPRKLKETKTDSCFFCARERRKALFRTAKELNCNKVALGHHLEDVNETFLLNLIFTASARTILPVQPLFKGALKVIRPLYYFTEEMITARLNSAHIRPVQNRCPYFKKGARILIRRFLNRLLRYDARVATNIFWGIHNLKPEYLPG